MLFWFTIPFLLPQGLYVRATAPRFSGAAGIPEGTVGEGPGLRLVGFGDSIIAGVGARDIGNALVGRTAATLAEKLCRRVRWSAHGFIGANSSVLLREHLPAMDVAGVDVFLLSIGVNDTTSLTPLHRWRRNLEQLFGRLADGSPGALIAFTGLPPMGGFPLLPQPLRASLGARARLLDTAARQVAAGFPQVVHIPVSFDTAPEKFAADGYHPNEDSYAEFAASMVEPIAAGLRAR